MIEGIVFIVISTLLVAFVVGYIQEEFYISNEEAKDIAFEEWKMALDVLNENIQKLSGEEFVNLETGEVIASKDEIEDHVYYCELLLRKVNLVRDYYITFC